MFQVCLHLHNEVERLESALQLVTVYVGAFAIVQLALRFKLHVVYDEAMPAWAGVHFIALTHIFTEKGSREAKYNKLIWQAVSFYGLYEINKWCSPEYYPVWSCLLFLV